MALPDAGAQSAPTGMCLAAADVPHVDSSRQRPPQQDVDPRSGESPAAPESQQTAESDSSAAAEAGAAVRGPVQVDINVSKCQEGGKEATEAAGPEGAETKVSVTTFVNYKLIGSAADRGGN